jgi:flagellin
MTVSTIASVAAGLTRALGNQNTKASAVFNSLIAASPRSASGDVANLSAAINLQNQIAQFRVASRDVAQASTVITTAEAGAGEVNKQLAKLRDLAARAASPALTAEKRAELNLEFQTLRGAIDRIVANTRFNNESLLDGNSAQLSVTGDGNDKEGASVGSLTTATLFKGANLDIATASGAKVAEATIKAAQDYANSQLVKLAALQESLDFAASTLQSAIQNQAAASSTLEDVDLTTALLSSNYGVEAGDISSLIAQTSGLPSNILQLLSE